MITKTEVNCHIYSRAATSIKCQEIVKNVHPILILSVKNVNFSMIMNEEKQEISIFERLKPAFFAMSALKFSSLMIIKIVANYFSVN